MTAELHNPPVSARIRRLDRDRERTTLDYPADGDTARRVRAAVAALLWPNEAPRDASAEGAACPQ